MFLVVFRNRKTPDFDAAAYAIDAAVMEDRARSQPGFLSFKSYVAEDGEVVALSEWTDEAAARAWGADGVHRDIQEKGRAEYYRDYTLFACADPRIHRYESERS